MPIALRELYEIDQFIDTFALGHYARVLGARDRRTGAAVAFKLMRREHLAPPGDEPKWEYRAFANEASLLARLADSPHLVRLLDCGYLDAPDDAPGDDAAHSEAHSFGRDARAFAAAQDEFAAQGWRPYLALEYLPRAHNLLYLMKPNRPDVRWRLPSEEGLALALQFGQLLKLAHSHRVVYLDHKLEHVYWDGALLRVIDLNSSRALTTPNETDDAQYFRMDVHNLCVGILYPLFTGLSPQKGALRPQPSGMAEVEGRYRDVTALDFGVEPTLSAALQALLQEGAAMNIASADDFLDGLREVAVLHGWDFPDAHTSPSPASRVAREGLRQGLRKLRDGQEAIRQARDLFREAAIQDGITEDLEDELRRLVKAANELLNTRVIP
jgi:serine/threonine protein kinase